LSVLVKLKREIKDDKEELEEFGVEDASPWHGVGVCFKVHIGLLSEGRAGGLLRPGVQIGRGRDLTYGTQTMRGISRIQLPAHPHGSIWK